MKQPYQTFQEWQIDMDKVRSNQNDLQLIEHVRGRFFASSKDVQDQVKDYLESVQFEKNPVAYGSRIAKQSNKLLFIKSAQDPWWSV
jgi:hypothetical protein